MPNTPETVQSWMLLMQTTILAGGLLVVILFAGTLLRLLADYLKTLPTPPASTPVTVPVSYTTGAPVESKSKKAVTAKPMAYCGHCGEGIYRDPVEAVDLATGSYMAYECATCNRRTLLNQ